MNNNDSTAVASGSISGTRIDINGQRLPGRLAAMFPSYEWQLVARRFSKPVWVMTVLFSLIRKLPQT